MNGIGQVSFAAAFALSINIGTAVYDIRKGEVSANIENMSLNCLTFQDDIAKMNWTLEFRGCTKRSKEHWEDAREQTVEGQCVKVQVCSDLVKQIEERMIRKSIKEHNQKWRLHLRREVFRG